jgi:hypothetical protein
MDNDAKMLQAMGNALVNLQIKYRKSPLTERMAMKPSLDQLVEDYADYQLRLLKEGVVSTDEDLAEMAKIKAAIDKAATSQKLLAALARTIAFVATKV